MYAHSGLAHVEFAWNTSKPNLTKHSIIERKHYKDVMAGWANTTSEKNSNICWTHWIYFRLTAVFKVRGLQMLTSCIMLILYSRTAHIRGEEICQTFYSTQYWHLKQHEKCKWSDVFLF